MTAPNVGMTVNRSILEQRYNYLLWCCFTQHSVFQEYIHSIIGGITVLCKTPVKEVREILS